MRKVSVFGIKNRRSTGAPGDPPPPLPLAPLVNLGPTEDKDSNKHLKNN